MKRKEGSEAYTSSPFKKEGAASQKPYTSTETKPELGIGVRQSMRRENCNEKRQNGQINSNFVVVGGSDMYGSDLRRGKETI